MCRLGKSNNPDNTNTWNLKNSKLGPYTTGPVDLYKCPADKYNCTINGQQMPRVRSISMNAFLEGGAYSTGDVGSTWYPAWRKYDKMTDIVDPPPSMLWVFVDEHPDSINDGWMITDVTNPNQWEDLPASYHNGACGFCFADGHSEVHKWHDPSTYVPVKKQSRNGFPAPNSRDLPWMIEHSSALRSGGVYP